MTQKSKSDAQIVGRILLLIMGISGICTYAGSFETAFNYSKNILVIAFEYTTTHIGSISWHIIGWGFLSYFVFSYFSLCSSVKEIQNQLGEITDKLDEITNTLDD